MILPSQPKAQASLPCISTLSRWIRFIAIILTLVIGTRFGITLTQAGHFADHRLGQPKNLNGYFPFLLSETPEAWEQRATRLRHQLLVANGLWPMPTRTPLNAVIHGRIDQGDYTVEKVFMETFPGYFLTGSLYRPKGWEGPRPAILSPHGHWNQGRFMENEDILMEINQGAERFENGGRSPLQSRNVQLARMGCVVFHYDMVGYADNQQISYELAHRFAEQREHMNEAEGWGLFSAQAEARLQSVMGLQTWNSIRALDFLTGLPEVDTDRLAITGASGGGTQSFMMGALDARLAACFPAVMVSTAMQGGCTCENASGLRIHEGNVAIAALVAPKPLGMTGANDWTVEMTTKGYPQLEQLYETLGHKERVSLAALNHFGHNYNYVSRSAMYHFMNRHLNLGLQTPIVERDYERQDKSSMTVWSHGYEAPEGGEAFEKGLLKYWAEDAAEQLAATHQSLHAFRHWYGTGIRAILGRELATAGETQLNIVQKTDRDTYWEMSGELGNTTHKESVTLLYLQPKQWNGRTLIWPTARGIAGLLNDQGQPSASVRKALEGGSTVIGMNLIGQGPSPLEANQIVNNGRAFAGYTYGYNHPLFAQRVHDILSVIQHVRHHPEPHSSTLELVGLAGAGHWVAAARALAYEVIDRSTIDTAGFHFANLKDYRDSNFLHGAVKYGDLLGMLALGTPSHLNLEMPGTQVVTLLDNLFASAGFPARLKRLPGDDLVQAALQP